MYNIRDNIIQINIYVCMYNIISNIIFYMPHDFILQRIRISIRTLSKYDRITNIKENKRKQKQKGHLYLVVSGPGTNASPTMSEGEPH